MLVSIEGEEEEKQKEKGEEAKKEYNKEEEEVQQHNKLFSSTVSASLQGVSLLLSISANLNFVRVPRDTKGFVSSRWHWTVLNHHHLDTRPLLRDTRMHTHIRNVKRLH